VRSDRTGSRSPEINPETPGIFAQQQDMAVVLGGFASRYLESRMLATKRSPAELISDMVQNELKAA
jgi:hypothetical protein